MHYLLFQAKTRCSQPARSFAQVAFNFSWHGELVSNKDNFTIVFRTWKFAAKNIGTSFMTYSGSPEPRVVYPTYGVHNPSKYSPCACLDCIYSRGPGEPSDPIYPEYWTATWKMYRVFN